MRVEEHVPLREHTTFRIGGPAAVFITAANADDIREAYALAHLRGRVVYPLGQGSNILAVDGAIEKVVLRLVAQHVTYEEHGTQVRVHADAGVSWDALVAETTARGLWGLENLAGIPGTVGAAPVQNIGAYGREVADSIVSVRAYDPTQDTFVFFSAADCAFGYRDSRFKRTPGLFITRVTFALSCTPQPVLTYTDLAERAAAGRALDTPLRIAEEVRAIRAQKFPDLNVYGTAGSFFKNPIISNEHFAQLAAQYPGIPGYIQASGTKVSLAWILDHVLKLRGFSLGPVTLFEKQPLVVVAEKSATAHDVDALADIVRTRVHDATTIFIEREVQTLA